MCLHCLCRLIVSGVYLPTFESVIEGGGDFGLTGLGRGGQQVQRFKTVDCRLTMQSN